MTYHPEYEIGPRSPGVWKEVRRLEDKVEKLRGALQRAREDMEGWGSYAGEYFQDKWDLAADLAAIDRVFKETEE